MKRLKVGAQTIQIVFEMSVSSIQPGSFLNRKSNKAEQFVHSKILKENFALTIKLFSGVTLAYFSLLCLLTEHSIQMRIQWVLFKYQSSNIFDDVMLLLWKVAIFKKESFLVDDGLPSESSLHAKSALKTFTVFIVKFDLHHNSHCVIKHSIWMLNDSLKGFWTIFVYSIVTNTIHCICIVYKY